MNPPTIGTRLESLSAYFAIEVAKRLFLVYFACNGFLMMAEDAGEYGILVLSASLLTDQATRPRAHLMAPSFWRHQVFEKISCAFPCLPLSQRMKAGPRRRQLDFQPAPYHDPSRLADYP